MNDPIKRTAAGWHEAAGVGGDVSPQIEAVRVAARSFAKVEARVGENWMAEVVAAANESRLRFLAEKPGNYAEALRDLVEHADTFVVVWRDDALPGGNAMGFSIEDDYRRMESFVVQKHASLVAFESIGRPPGLPDRPFLDFVSAGHCYRLPLGSS
jgi:hypothetical protein